MALAGSIEQGNDTRKRGCASRSTRHTHQLTADVHSVLVRLRAHVGEAAAVAVKELAVRVADLLEVLADGKLLVERALVVHGETARGKIDGLLGRRLVGAAYGSHPGAGAGEGGLEVSGVGAVVADARVAGPGVAAAENDGYAARAELADHGAYLERVLAGHGLLFFAVGG